ncbi:hypothetical protein OBBRIDRAFT_660048 [Obba rivulosa]|uniref:Uncharacterized protein n=1 Tax=Obba rivulosa TaxID=1052685 RepID=A0A8E2AWF5_9APHY|nr:hypothetical protein OBBRIDRAFT_660048 [Obba rivulosa]
MCRTRSCVGGRLRLSVSIAMADAGMRVNFLTLTTLGHFGSPRGRAKTLALRPENTQQVPSNKKAMLCGTRGLSWRVDSRPEVLRSRQPRPRGPRGTNGGAWRPCLDLSQDIAGRLRCSPGDDLDPGIESSYQSNSCVQSATKLLLDVRRVPGVTRRLDSRNRTVFQAGIIPPPQSWNWIMACYAHAGAFRANYAQYLSPSAHQAHCFENPLKTGPMPYRACNSGTLQSGAWQSLSATWQGAAATTRIACCVC